MDIEPKNANGNPLRYFTLDNRLLTTQMFAEYYDPTDGNVEWPPQYTLLSYDVPHPTISGQTLPSLHKLYVEAQDLSEYTFANTHFYNYTHWELVKSLPVFGKFYEVMRGELEAKLSSNALQQMVLMVRTGTATQSTLKYLADKDYSKAIPQAKTKGNPHAPSADLHVIHGDDLDRISS